MKILGLITARGGSKGIPKKNIRSIAGKPLIGWTIESALQSNKFTDVVVSTDDDEIARVAKAFGASIPFMRSPQLARDDTPGMAAVLDALEKLPDFDAVMLLQPTSPLRKSDDIAACIEYADAWKINSITSVSEAHNHPYWTFSVTPNNVLKPLHDGEIPKRRQDLPLAYSINGAIYYALVDWLRDRGDFIGSDTHAYVMPPERSIDIDTPLDWKIAELLLREVSC
jgi:CMP-N,N'-diacetyllegionaminic acid synthase